MKKFLPLVILLIGIAVLVGAFLFVRSKNSSPSSTAEEENVSLIPANKIPTVTMTKSSDGHYINLKVEKLDGLSPKSLDYELLYEVPGQTQSQGTGSSVDVSGKSSFEADLLLGTESSGKFRYDEGVEKGTLTLKFRNDKGKLIGRTKTEFDLASGKVDTASY